MNTIRQKILDNIKNKHLTPRPRWQFTLKNNTLWILAGSTTIIGGFAIAIILFIFTDTDWDIFKFLDKSPLQAILIAMPYIWLVIFICIVSLIDTGITKTIHGYKYTQKMIIGGSILSSIVIGTVLYTCGFGKVLHDALADQIPWYENLMYTKKNLWFYPEKGLLSGTIQSVNETTFTLIAPDKSIWTVSSSPEIFEEENLTPGLQIKIVGEETAEKSFTMEDIRLWNE